MQDPRRFRVFQFEATPLLTSLPDVRGLEGREIDLNLLNQVIHLRVREILELVKLRLEATGRLQAAKAGVFLTGGGSLLKGMPELVGNVFMMKVNEQPEDISSGSKTTLRLPQYATLIGLVRYAQVRERRLNPKRGPCPLGNELVAGSGSPESLPYVRRHNRREALMEFHRKAGKSPPSLQTAPEFSSLELGAAGANILRRIVMDGGDPALLVCMDTDLGTLNSCAAANRVQLGGNLTKGLTAGGDPDLGREAAQESEQQIRQTFRGVNLVFVHRIGRRNRFRGIASDRPLRPRGELFRLGLRHPAVSF